MAAKKKKWIQGAIKKPWALRKALGVKKGKKVPKGEINKIAKAKVGTKVDGKKVTSKLKKRADLAKTLSKLKRKKK